MSSGLAFWNQLWGKMLSNEAKKHRKFPLKVNFFSGLSCMEIRDQSQVSFNETKRDLGPAPGQLNRANICYLNLIAPVLWQTPHSVVSCSWFVVKKNSDSVSVAGGWWAGQAVWFMTAAVMFCCAPLWHIFLIFPESLLRNPPALRGIGWTPPPHHHPSYF